MVITHCHEPEIVVDNIEVAQFVAPAVRVTPLLTAAAVAIQLSANSALAGALEDCTAAYDRKDYAVALQPCLSLAEHGDARAQFSLGGMYYNGQGVQQDYAEAAEWTRKAARTGLYPGAGPPRRPVLEWPRGAARRCYGVHVAQFGGRKRAGCGEGT